MYTDLKEHFGFDLIEWIAGNAYGTPATVFAMLRALPEGSSFVARMSAPSDQEGRPELDEATLAFLDRKTWTQDRMLDAQVINLLSLLVKYTINWGEEKNVPQFDIVGPAAWREANESAQKKAKTIDDVFAMFTSR